MREEIMGIEYSIIFYSTLAGLATMAGIALGIIGQGLILRYSHYVNSFAAGLILGVAFFHLFPESLELSGKALLFIFLGFLAIYLLENVMVLHSGSEIHFREKNNPRLTKGMVIFSGLFFHSLIDGVIIGVGFEVNPRLGVLTSLGIISHELPEGVTSFSLLVTSIARKTAMKMAIAVALATPFGAILSLAFIGGLADSTIGLLLAMAGGSFLYIAASDLIPETHEKGGVANAGFFLLGILFLFFLSKMITG
jgi:zinc and cadmium transporter